MARPSTGQVVVRDGKTGRTYALRFRAYGRREYLTLGTAAEGWDQRRAQTELENILADVRRGIWQPPEAPAPMPPLAEEPTIRELAAEWQLLHRGEWRARTTEYAEWALAHLLPTFGDLLPSMVGIADVDAYKTAKLRDRENGAERPLSNSSINKTLEVLSGVLEIAVERQWITMNPARGKRRRLKSDRAPGSWLEPDQVGVVLAVAGANRPVLSTAILAGLRSGELCALRWADVDLARGRLNVRESKTSAGVRKVDMTPDLRDVLAAHKAGTQRSASTDLVFTTSRGTPQTQANLRRRVLPAAIRSANLVLLAEGKQPINPRVSPRSLRHTCASLLAEAGAPVPYAMEQLGHTSPGVTLRIYSHAMNRKRPAGARIDAIVRGDEWAQMGTNADSAFAGDAASAEETA